MENRIPIQEAKFYQAIMIAGRYSLQVNVKVQEFQKVQMTFVDGLYLEVKAAKDEYIVFPANIIHLIPKPKEVAIEPVPRFEMVKKNINTKSSKK